MKRSQFIGNIIALFGIAVLPKHLIKQYHKCYLLQSFIRGFRFYDGPKLLADMKEGNMLQLIREHDNQHDEFAVALHFNQQKIGYLPREDNEIISRLIDADVIEMLAEITHLKPEAAAWENVHVAVYILKETNNSLPAEAQYITMLDTPEYRTLQYKNNMVSRVYYEEPDEEIQDGEGFYEALVEHSETNDVYTLIHEGFERPEKMEDAVKEMKLVINKQNLPADLQNNRVTQAIDEAVIELNEYFDKEGYVVANVNELAKLSSRLEKFVEITDKQSRRFYEVVFKKGLEM